MELQFHKKSLRCMRQVAWETKNEEQTLEIRVTEDMPPIDKILAAWGQPIIRTKEWDGDQASVSGGVLAWILYDAQNGAGPQKVEGWIPFQFKWELTDSVRDGVFHTQWLLRSIDARLTGAGKLMVRASVSALGRGMEETSYDLYTPGELPADIQINTEELAFCIPAEAGEKVMHLDEEMVIPPGRGEIDTVLAYMLRPTITEKKLMSDKFVFRGVAKLQVIYMGTDGRIHTYETDIPISQYTQLEREYGPDARLQLIPELSELELERTDPTRLRVKGSVIGQYAVWEVQTANVVTDAYSNRREVELQMAELSLLDMIGEEKVEHSVFCAASPSVSEAVACTMWMGQPVVKNGENGGVCVLEGNGQVLYYDDQGLLCAESKAWDGGVEFTGEGQLQTMVSPNGFAAFCVEPEGTGLLQVMHLNTVDIRNRNVNLVSGLTFGDVKKADPGRPSLILCSTGGKSLWQLARECGSTVSHIRMANNLEGDPEPQKMLVIPVE